MSLVEETGPGTTRVLRLNAPPVNALTFDLLDALRTALRRAQADAQVKGIIITGDARHFSSGADINLFQQISSSADAVRTSRVFQEAFQEIEDSSKPVAAAVAGRVMGGALELALACHCRIAAAGSRFSLPEVNLGINPGAGGTQRLPRLIGAGPALTMLLTGSAINAEEALATGLIDAVGEGKALLAKAADLLNSSEPRPKTSARMDKVQDARANNAACAAAAARVANVRPELIAPAKILEAVKTGLHESFAAGLRREQTGFAECLATRATQNKIHLFFATRETSKVPSLVGAKPGRIAQVAVVGLGAMGTGIAHALILAGVPVVALDQNEAARQKGLDQIRGSLAKRVAQQKCSREQADQMLDRLRAGTNWADLAPADLIIEAVFEDGPIKRDVIAAIENTCRADAIIASNTSTISLDQLAEGMRHPDRLLGLHFFNPAQRMPLVEVIQRQATPPAVTATVMRFAKAIRKTPVLVRNREGFIVNRMFVPYLKEAFWLLEEGAPAPAVDQAMVEFGFPMGPFVLIDMAGLDILVQADQVLRHAFPQHGPLPSIALNLVQRGHLGQKSGAGVYDYENGGRDPRDSEMTRELIRRARREKGLNARNLTKAEITERLVLRMVTEAFQLLAEGVARREADINVASVLGMGFPDFRGGVLNYAHDQGLAAIRTRLDALAAQFGERYLPWARDGIRR